jgi:hypothetical protein
VLFHAGQNFFDQNRTPEAARCFRESHALRREAGMDELRNCRPKRCASHRAG